MKRSTSEQLQSAAKDKQIVSFGRTFEGGKFYGIVVGVGPRWFLLSVINDRVCFDGFACLRLADVRNLQVPHRYAKFLRSALIARRDRPPRHPRIDLASPESILSSVNRHAPLVTVHREKISPETCRIGRFLGVEGREASLLEICPDAKWEDRPRWFKLSDVTRIDFGGGYENALHVVGGRPDDAIR